VHSLTTMGGCVSGEAESDAKKKKKMNSSPTQDPQQQQQRGAAPSSGASQPRTVSEHSARQSSFMPAPPPPHRHGHRHHNNSHDAGSTSRPNQSPTHYSLFGAGAPLSHTHEAPAEPHTVMSWLKQQQSVAAAAAAPVPAAATASTASSAATADAAAALQSATPRAGEDTARGGGALTPRGGALTPRGASLPAVSLPGFVAENGGDDDDGDADPARQRALHKSNHQRQSPHRSDERRRYSPIESVPAQPPKSAQNAPRGGDEGINDGDVAAAADDDVAAATESGNGGVPRLNLGGVVKGPPLPSSWADTSLQSFVGSSGSSIARTPSASTSTDMLGRFSGSDVSGENAPDMHRGSKVRGETPISGTVEAAGKPTKRDDTAEHQRSAINSTVDTGLHHHASCRIIKA
jgi:hypothetical protein